MPAARVLMLHTAFLYRRDRTYALISASVLTVLSAGVLIGLCT